MHRFSLSWCVHHGTVSQVEQESGGDHEIFDLHVPGVQDVDIFQHQWIWWNIHPWIFQKYQPPHFFWYMIPAQHEISVNQLAHFCPWPRCTKIAQNEAKIRSDPQSAEQHQPVSRVVKIANIGQSLECHFFCLITPSPNLVLVTSSISRFWLPCFAQVCEKAFPEKWGWGQRRGQTLNGVMLT